MPKMKISKTVRDRFKVTGRGKILRRKVGHRHLMSTKSNMNLRRGKEPIRVTGELEAKLRKMMGI